MVTNPGPIDLAITSLNDDVYGDLGDPANPDVSANTCDDLIGDTLTAGGGSTTCSFVGVFNGVAGDTETDTVTVVGTDANGNTATDDDDAVVTIARELDIAIVKSVTPSSRPEPGGAFTFDLLVTNPGLTDIAITSLVDDVYGDLGDPANPGVSDNTCDELIGDTLVAGGAGATCSFVGVFNGVAGDSETDTVTVVGTDANGDTATDDRRRGRDDRALAGHRARQVRDAREPAGARWRVHVRPAGHEPRSDRHRDHEPERRRLRRPRRSREPGREREHVR